MKKIIFLDFDGVINNWYTPKDIKVDYENILVLKKIIDITKAKIVATTSNKRSFQKSFCEIERSNYYKYVKGLKEYGIDIYDVTPLGKNREEEILMYLKANPNITHFLIIDDDYIFKSLKNHQVYLDLYDGLKKEHIIPSINILNNKLGFYPPNYNCNETFEQKLIRINKHYNNQSL